MVEAPERGRGEAVCARLVEVVRAVRAEPRSQSRGALGGSAALYLTLLCAESSDTWATARAVIC